MPLSNNVVHVSTKNKLMIADMKWNHIRKIK